MLRPLRFLPAVALLALTAACGHDKGPCSMADRAAAPTASGAANAGASAPASAGTDATRLVAEADIVQLDDAQKRIYAMSKSGTLAIVDAMTPGALTLLGKTALPGQPFEMYRRGDVLVTMSNGAIASDGSLYGATVDASTTSTTDTGSGAVVAAVDIRDPANAKTTATLKVPGEIADSRIVGDILYLATYENATCWSCSTLPRTLVTSFDLTDATAPKQIDQISYDGSNDAGGFNAAWSTPWKRSITATATRMYVGGLTSDPSKATDEGTIEVIDITDPAGHLRRGTHVTIAGPIMSRWQMDETNGILRVVSQRGAGQTQNGDQYPDVDTFRIESSDSIVRIGHMTLQLPQQEGLKTVRFDGNRGYAISFNQTDPLFTIDLTDPTKPVQKGSLTMPGWVFDIEPRGDRLIGLGLDRNDTAGNLNVSLFDVSDLAKPSMIQRVSFGPTHMYEDYMITQGVLAEDQDRIQKAFAIFDDGLIAVPFSGGDGSCTSDSTTVNGGGVQLLDWTSSSLTKQAMLPVAGNPRRAVRRDTAAMKTLIAISDSNVSSFTINQHSAVLPTANVVIGTCVARTAGGIGLGGMMGNDVGYAGGQSLGNDDSCY